MLPIVSISALGGVLIFAAGTILFYRSYRSSKNELTRHFAWGLATATVAVTFVGLPGTLVTQPRLADVCFDVFAAIIVVSLAHFLKGFLEYVGWERAKGAVFWSMATFAFFMALVSVLNFNEADIFPSEDGRFIYYEDTRERPVDIALGLVVTPLGALLAAFYFRYALRAESTAGRVRAIAVTGIMALMVVAGITQFLLGGPTEENPEASYIVVSFGAVGTVIVAAFFTLKIFDARTKRASAH